MLTEGFPDSGQHARAILEQQAKLAVLDGLLDDDGRSWGRVR